MGAKKQSETRYVVTLRNRNPKVRTIEIWPEGESPTCDTIEQAKSRMDSMRATIALMPADMLYEGWKVRCIEAIEVRTEHDAPGTDAIHSHTFAPRTHVSAAA